jgi:hypothetical protein
MATRTRRREVLTIWRTTRLVTKKGEAYVAELVDTPTDKPISCSFLRQGAGRKDEVKYTFHMSKCDRLLDVLVKGG